MAGLRARRGGGDTVTGELSGEGDRTGSGRRLPRGCFRPRRRRSRSQLVAPGALGGPGWVGRAGARRRALGVPASRDCQVGGAGARGARGGGAAGRAGRSLTDAQLDGVGVVGPAEQEADEHHRDPVEHPPAPPPHAARTRGRHLPAASTCPAPLPPPPPAGLAPGRAGRARRPRRDGPRGGGRVRRGHCRRRGAKSPSRSPEPAPRTPRSSARRRRWLREEGAEAAAGRSGRQAGGGGGGGGGSLRPASARPARPPASPSRPPARRGPRRPPACARGTASGACRAPGPRALAAGHLTGIRAGREGSHLGPSIPALRPGSLDPDEPAPRGARTLGGGAGRGDAPGRGRRGSRRRGPDPLAGPARSGRDATPGGATPRSPQAPIQGPRLPLLRKGRFSLRVLVNGGQRGPGWRVTARAPPFPEAFGGTWGCTVREEGAPWVGHPETLESETPVICSENLNSFKSLCDC